MPHPLIQYLDPQAILPNLAAHDRQGALRELAKVLSKIHPDIQEDAIMQALAEREKDGTTGIGMGVAIPHARMAGLKNLLLAFGRSEKGVDFAAIDGKPVHLFFLLLAPEKSSYLKFLAVLAQHCQNQNFCNTLMRCKNAEEIFKTLKLGA